MPASVEGTFRIIDRASGPMRRMEKQAQQTDRAITRLGRSMDALGTRKHTRQLENYERSLRNLRREGESIEKVFNRLDKQGGIVSNRFNRVGRDSDTLTRSLRGAGNEGNKVVTMLGRLGAAAKGVGTIFSVMKLPFLITGIALLAKAIAPLVGGLTALVPQLVGTVGAIGAMIPQLGRLSAALAGIPATFIGLGLAMVTVKMATKDLSEALGGNAQALARLTPEARAFLKTLQGFKPTMNTLKASAQGGLFGGLDTALRRMRVALPYVNVLLKDMSARMGSLAAQAAGRFTQRSFLQDFFALGQQGGRIVSTLGRSLGRLVSALRHVAIAAMPFTDWLRTTIEGWSKFIERSAKAGRETGRLAAFFDRARRTMTIFGHIARNIVFALNDIARAASPTGGRMWQGLERATATFHKFTSSFEGQAKMRLWFQHARVGFQNVTAILGNLWKIFVGIGRAANETGDSLWTSLRKATAGWARTVNSIGGQIKLREFFAEMRESFTEISLLLQDLGIGIMQVGRDQRGFPQMIRHLRTIIPMLVNLIDVISRAFGPPVVAALAEFGRLLGNLTGATGPIGVMLSLFSTILRIINTLLERIPMLGPIVMAALTLVGINFAITKVRALAAAWGMVAGSATAATVAQGTAAGTSVVAGGGLGMFGRGGIRGAAARTSAAVAIGGVGSVAKMGLKTAGRFLWPVAALAGGLGAVTAPKEGNFGMQTLQTLSGAVSGASFGLIPRIKTGSERSNEQINRILEGGSQRKGENILGRISTSGSLLGRSGLGGGRMERTVGLRERLTGLGGENPRTIAQLRGQIAAYGAAISAVRREKGSDARQTILELQNEMMARDGVLRNIRRTRQEVKLLRAQAAAEKSRVGARGLLRDLGERFNIVEGRKGTAGAFEDLNARVIDRLRTDPRLKNVAGRKMFASRLLGWAEKNAPKKEVQELQRIVTSEWGRAGDNIQIVNGKILTNSRRNWMQIRQALVGEAERARQEVSGKFTALQQIAAGQLRALGYSPAQANALVKAMERGATGPTSGPSRHPISVAGGHGGLAHGGRIPGIGRQDTVQIAPGNMAAPGELVVNRHTESKVDRLLGAFGHTLGGLVSREKKPHFMAEGGRVQPGIASISEAVRTKFPGLVVTSTTEGRHAANSYHYKGMAHDIGGPPALMHAASEWIKTSGLFKKLLEGIHNPNLSVKDGQMVDPSFWGAKTWAGHANHMHLAAGAIGALGNLAGAATPAALLGALRAPQSALGGLPGAMSNMAGRRLAVAMRARINRRIRRGAGGVGGGGAPVGGGNQAIAHQMMLASGWGEAEWAPLKALWMGESGFNELAKNASSGAYGIPQSLPGTKMASAGRDWRTNPSTQIRWGLDYIRGRYGSPGAAYAAWQKRSPHWYGGGGDFLTSGPTLIGVGEKGRERVTITPAHGRAGGPNLGPFHFTIHNNRPGDVRRQIEEEVTQAMQNLARKVEMLPTVGDKEVLG